MRIRIFLLVQILVALWLAPSFAYCDEVSLRNEDGVYTVPVKLNGVLVLNFVVDSGASDMMMPTEVVMTLLHAGTITKKDFLPGQTYHLADGSFVNSSRFKLRSIQVGNVVLHDVPAAIGPVQSSLLLGQSFLSRLKTWSIDYDRHVLILRERDAISNSTENSGGPEFSKIINWVLWLFGIEKSTLGNLAFFMLFVLFFYLKELFTPDPEVKRRKAEEKAQREAAEKARKEEEAARREKENEEAVIFLGLIIATGVLIYLGYLAFLQAWIYRQSVYAFLSIPLALLVYVLVLRHIDDIPLKERLTKDAKNQRFRGENWYKGLTHRNKARVFSFGIALISIFTMVGVYYRLWGWEMGPIHQVVEATPSAPEVRSTPVPQTQNQ